MIEDTDDGFGVAEIGERNPRNLAIAQLIVAAPETSVERDRFKTINAALMAVIEKLLVEVDAYLDYTRAGDTDSGMDDAADAVKSIIDKAKEIQPVVELPQEAWAEYSIQDWMYDVANWNTELGYKDWVAYKFEIDKTGIGRLWWIAEDDQEAQEMQADLIAKGCTILAADKRSDDGRHDITFSLPKAKANEMLGYEVEEEEWLID